MSFKYFSLTLGAAPAHGGHGHSHAAVSSLSLRSLIMLVGLAVHSILEGLAIGLQVGIFNSP